MEWRRGVTAPKSKNFRDPEAYLPKPVRKLVNDWLEHMRHQTYRELNQVVRNRKPCMSSMLVYAIHQCCNSDKLKSCEKIMGMLDDEDLRTIIVNAPYGRSGYSPLVRAAYFGSEQMVRFLVSCGANLLYKNKHNEGILDALRTGLAQALEDCQYVKVSIKEKRDRRNNTTYQITFPDRKHAVTLTSLTHVIRKKYTPANQGYVKSSQFGYNTNNSMFIKERYANCKAYILKSITWQAKQQVKKPRTKKFLGKHPAALRIQTWFRFHSKKPPPPPPTISRDDIFACDALSGEAIQAFVADVKACHVKRATFCLLYAEDATVKEFVNMDVPILKVLL
jgi:hypothetical protein